MNRPKMRHYKVAICLPSKNEADSIVNTVIHIDAGLRSILNPKEYVLVNVDSSTDSTIQAFLDTPTEGQKLSLPNVESGKGTQLLNFLSWCKKENIPYAATIDTDIKTIADDWAPKLLLPLLKNEADFVSPLYERSRFEGNTTNHFAMPILYAWFGKLVRQPIGGEFAFNYKTYNYFLEQPTFPEVKQYGIDIFFTAHALGAQDIRTIEVVLGQKLHKPSFPKIIPMFQQVFTTGLLALQQYNFVSKKNGEPEEHPSSGIIDGGSFAHKAQLEGLRIQMLNDVRSSLDLYEHILDKANVYELLNTNGHMSSEFWATALTAALKEFMTSDRSHETARATAKLITPLFMLRTITYMLENETKTAEEVEETLRAQAKLIKSKLK